MTMPIIPDEALAQHIDAALTLMPEGCHALLDTEGMVWAVMHYVRDTFATMGECEWRALLWAEPGSIRICEWGKT